MRILLMLCCLSSVSFLWGAPWGALKDYESPSRPADGGTSNIGERYLLRQVLAGQPVKVRLVEGEESDETLASWREKIQAAYDEWFFNTAKHIRNAKREREFADILPLLEKGISVEFVSGGEDITVEFVDRREIERVCTKLASACYVFDGPKIYVPKNPRRQNAAKGLLGASSGKVMFANLLHEIGHSLGFSDQYLFARDSNTHSIYRGENTDNTIMNSKNKSLTCDDADGIVNLIDITRKNHRGGKNGWRSLCKKSTAYYVDGMQLGRGPYEIVSADDNAWIVKIYQDGAVKEERSFVPCAECSLSPFMPFSEKVLRRDQLNRPVLSQGPNGEKIYYMYLYDTALRLVTQNGKHLMVEDRTTLAENGKRLRRRSVWFYANGREAFLHSDQAGSKGVVHYSEGKNGELVSLDMRFNKKNHFALWSGSKVENAHFPRVQKPVAQSALARRLSGKITKQVEKKLSEAQKQRLAEQVAQWYFNEQK